MEPGSLTNKIILTLKVIKNIHIFILDFLGLIRSEEVVYQTWNNLKLITRTHTSDKSEIVVVAGGSEYPNKYFPKGKHLIVVDIGAHIGSFSAYLSRSMIADQPKVYAIEPSGKNFGYLTRNIKLNNFNFVRCFNIAIGESDGYGYIDTTKDFDAFSISQNENPILESSKNIEKCRVLTLESFCRNERIEKIDLLKMDCEGGEHKIFNKSLKFIQENVRYLFVEVHCLPGERNVAEFEAYLIENKFSVEARICKRTLYAKNMSLT